MFIEVMEYLLFQLIKINVQGDTSFRASFTTIFNRKWRTPTKGR
jgi:hypothetical protein